MPRPVGLTVPSAAATTMEEGHFHVYGACGVLLIDSRGNRVAPDGSLCAAARPGASAPATAPPGRLRIRDG